MAMYEKRLQEDLTRIRDKVRGMGDMAERALQNAVHALLSHDHRLANATVLADHPINRSMREIDRLCHGFIARHLPSAGALRLISSIMRINIELERIGDYSVIISRESILLTQPLEAGLAQEVGAIAAQAQRMLHQALTAFYTDNVEAARTTIGMAASLEGTLDGLYGSLMTGQHELQLRDMFALFAALAQIKRVADQSKNVCEETIFAITGQTKAMKVYNVLFVDEENRCFAPMAEAIARKNHPNSGRYTSGARNPAAAVDPGVAAFMARRGFDLDRVLPQPVLYSKQELATLNVIVGLQGSPREYFPAIPFHTTFLEWDLGAIPAQPDDERYSEIYRELSVHIQELMELLRGEGAD